MGMGGGSGGAVPDAGLSPMQKANWDIGKELINGQGKNLGAMTDVRQQGLALLNLSRGGLMGWGMDQVQKGLNTPDIGPGMTQRDADRYGLMFTPEQIQAGREYQALARSSASVAAQNTARRGLAQAQYGMRVGGITS